MIWLLLLLDHDHAAATRSIHGQRMESDPATKHAREGAALADFSALQLGTRRRHDAFVSRSRQKKRGALFGSIRRCRGDSRAARISAVVTRRRIVGLTRSRAVCISEERIVGIDCPFTRYWFARSQAAVSES